MLTKLTANSYNYFYLVTLLSLLRYSCDEFGLIDPNQQAEKGAGKLAYWITPFGFVAGYVFNVLTGIELFSFSNSLTEHIIGGILGAVSGLLGAFIVGGGLDLTVGSKDVLTYRNRHISNYHLNKNFNRFNVI